MSVAIPRLKVQQKWKTAESNLIYFVVSRISYAKAHGETAEDFGRWAGKIASPYWEEEKSQGVRGLVEGIARNKQQFHDFEIEILNESGGAIQARMKGFGEDLVRRRSQHEISVDEYTRFFEKKWIEIADFMGLEYHQKIEGD
jgi:hypothetical protein